MSLKIGDTAVDMLTGFKGVIVARTEYLNGNVSIGIQCLELKDGRPLDVQWFDATRVSPHKPKDPGQYI